MPWWLLGSETSLRHAAPHEVAWNGPGYCLFPHQVVRNGPGTVLERSTFLGFCIWNGPERSRNVPERSTFLRFLYMERSGTFQERSGTLHFLGGAAFPVISGDLNIILLKHRTPPNPSSVSLLGELFQSTALETFRILRGGGGEGGSTY